MCFGVTQTCKKQLSAFCSLNFELIIDNARNKHRNEICVVYER